jgi:hypothetical protein
MCNNFLMRMKKMAFESHVATLRDIIIVEGRLRDPN